MARYRGKKAAESLLILIIGGLILALIILKFAITLALILFPLFILIAFIFYFIKEKLINQKIEEAKRAIWCSQEEVNQLNQLSDIISVANNKIQEANEIADSEGISRNVDGSISLRSKRGKELVSIIDENDHLVYQNYDAHQQLRDLPLERWKNYLILYTRKRAFLYSLIAYIISLPILTFIFLHSLSGDAFDKVLFFPSIMFKEGNLNLPQGKAMWLTFLITICAFFIGIFIAKQSFNKEIKKP